MTNGRNFIAGVVSSGWTALIGLLAVPWYIRYLGIEAYGMIGVHLTIQSMFVLLDMGISPAVSREVARASVNNTMHQARILVHSMSVVFVVSGCVMAAIAAGLAPWLARNWLNAGSLPIGQVTLAIVLSAVAVGARWPATLYVGVLNGAKRIDLASAVTMATTTLANAGAVAVLVFVEPSLRAFFIWQAMVGVIHSVAMRAAARHALGKDTTARFDWAAMRSIWRFSAGMAGVAMTGILFSQIDKIVLMRTATLDQVGHYTIAISLAGVLYRLVTPAFNVTYPQLCALIEQKPCQNLSYHYNSLTRLFLMIILPVAMLLIVCARPILTIWIRDPIIVNQTFLIVMLLVGGTSIHCVMYFPYALQIASGMPSIPFLINTVLSLIFLPLVFYLSSARGAMGTAIAWLILHSCYFFLGTWLTHRRILPGKGWGWVLRAVAPPFTISVGFGVAAAAIMLVVSTDVARLLIGAVCALAAWATGALLLPEGRMLLNRAPMRRT